MNIDIPMKVQFAGRYQLIVRGPDGEIKRDTGWFENLITNHGLDDIGAAYGNDQKAFGTHCAVGTGTTAPAITDTALTAFTAMYPTAVAQGSGITAFTTATYVTGTNPYWSGILTYAFAQGAVVANIAEIGCGNTATGDIQPTLFSHALIVDGTGTPTTISLTAIDQLTVNYELRMYLNLTDNTYSMVISGTTYSGTYRMGQSTTVNNFNLCMNGLETDSSLYAPYLTVYNGSIGTVTGTPSGTSSGGANASNTETTTITAYSTGTYSISYSSAFSITQGNVPGGITAIMTTTQQGSYQFGLTPALPKTNSYTLTINWSVTWSRYP